MSEADNVLLPAEFPTDWPISTVGAQFHIILGKMLDAEKNVGKAKPYLGNRSVQWGQIDVSDLDLIKLTEGDLRKYRLQSGDLLVCEGGDIGRAALWQDQLEECYFQKALHRLRPRGTYSSVLMRYFLEYYARIGFLTNFATQTSIAHLPKDKFVTVPLPLPTHPEQQAIAAALSDADGVVAGLERVIAKKRLIKQGAMQDLLTARRRLPGFSGEWEEATISDVAHVDPEALGAGTPKEYTFRYISLEDVNQGVLSAWTDVSFGSAPSRARRILQKDDVLLGTVRPNLKSHMLFDRLGADWIGSTGFAVLRSRSDKCIPGYLFELIMSDVIGRQIDEVIAGSNYPAISNADVRRLKVMLPTIGEQQAIAAILRDMDAEIQTLESRLAKARAVKEGMMQNLLTGRVRLA
ncbi:MAG: restriction endonuclease subunit S [Alkalilacustris sp.]